MTNLTSVTETDVKQDGTLQSDYSIPDDLYVPPDALIVVLQQFTGPLDLLLYLIRKQNLDILDLPIAEITEQYMAYIDVMTDLRFELAGDYLVMAATLAEIKSKMMLPRISDLDDEEEDPRALLARQLLEYEQFKMAAEDLDVLPRENRDFFVSKVGYDRAAKVVAPPPVLIDSLISVLRELIEKQKLKIEYQIQYQQLSVSDRMKIIMETVMAVDGFVPFTCFYDEEERSLGVIVSFIALLELMKEREVKVIQTSAFAPIYVAKKSEITQ
ncbi:MAG: segregation/condensation protein A [Gammaproteobacteria bacterium]|nr:segregation/condensation protein A [Gammaproteobacteria bacterium]